MKALFLMLLLLMAAAAAAPADEFQMKIRKDKDSYNAAYATVVITQNGTTLFNGQTDRVGRITISLPNGDYYAQVVAGKSDGAFQPTKLTIDGSTPLKLTYVN
jgi:5-hydroxyisourate hydrolase-like protein (transthyretin family)